MNVKITKNLPIPPKNAGTTRYPWDELEVGDSFPVKSGTNGTQLCRQAMTTRHPKVFEARVTKGKARVWRTA